MCGALLGSARVDKPNSLWTPTAGTIAMITKCYRQLKNYLYRPDASSDVALVCSVIFYTFESIIGDSEKAIWHLDRGLILLKQSQVEPKSSNDPLIQQLSSLFQRLDVQASSFDDRRIPVLTLASLLETKGLVSVVPDTFVNVTQAEDVLMKLQNWTLHHLVLNFWHKGKSLEESPPHLLHERQVLSQQFEKYGLVLATLARFLKQSDAYTRKGNELLQLQQLQRLLLLQVHFHSFHYMIKGNNPDSTTKGTLASDNVKKVSSSSGPFALGSTKSSLGQTEIKAENGDDNLKAALTSMTTFLSLSSSTEPQSSSPVSTTISPLQRSYTLSTHLIAGLYYVCLKTTSPSIFTEAFTLFSHPSLQNSRDGLWDCQTAAYVVEKLVKMKNKGSKTHNQVDCSNVPAELKSISIPISKLEDYGPGIIDTQGGVVEAAKKFSTLSV